MKFFDKVTSLPEEACDISKASLEKRLREEKEEKKTKRYVVSVSTCGVENNSTTQCSWITTVVCNDGTLFQIRNNDNEWCELPSLPY